ncbi:hypothetical protein PRIC2_001594 [Phytophthora ramorum]
MYLAFSTQVSDVLQSLLETTGVSVEPAVEFVSCGAKLHEHFVPKASLEKHLRKCHGERRPQPINNPSFYYGRNNGEDPKGLGPGGEEVKDEEDSEGLRSLLEAADAESEDDGLEQGVIAAIRRTATSAGGLYQHVQAWQRIPRAFASMQKCERELVTSSSLRRWLNAELSRLPGDEPVDEELADYVAGLLDHPDFCQPDLLVLELHEFLGSSVGNFVLSLWKFLIVEIGLHSVLQTEKAAVDNMIQMTSVGKNHEPDTLQPQISDANGIAERDYKRRRTSYRGKIGTKTGPAAFRDMIQKHMVGLSLELDRDLVHGGGFEEEGFSFSKWPHPVQVLQTTTVGMAQRFSDPSPSGNNNNFVSDRSSTRQCKPPGGGSTVGSLIFGDGGDGNQPSYLDERKSRRFNPHQSEGPEHNGSNNKMKTPDAGAAELSYYAKSSAAQELRDRLAVAPGAVSREALSQQSSALTVVRRSNHSGNSSNYFANGMGGQEGGDNQLRRTRRMFAAPGGNSSFKLG